MLTETIVRAGWLGWMLARGERVQPAAVAGRLGVQARSVRALLETLSGTLPITQHGGTWFCEAEMETQWELLAVEALPAASALGRLRDVMHTAERAALEAERAAAEAAQAYGEAQAWLAAARWGTVTPEEFAAKTAAAELLRRELPALNATVEARHTALVKRREAFAAQYRNYERNITLRAQAVRQGNINEIRRYETAILAAVADG